MFLLLLIRLFYLQIIAGDRLSRAASMQRMVTSVIYKPRGDIVDRNLIPLTNRTTKWYMVLQPVALEGRDEEIMRICDILGLNYNNVRREMEVKKEPLIFETDEQRKNKVLELGIQGVSAINSLERYNINTVAKHVLGYLNKIDLVGEAGIEKFYEGALKLAGGSSISAVTDARNNLVQGIGYRLQSPEETEKKLNVRLTLDYHIQKIVEKVMDDAKVTGAVVVEDVYTGDILAIASKPDFDPNNVQNYLKSSNNELFNRAVAAYNIGSIFKIIVAAAAMENNIPFPDEYFCEGYIDVSGIKISCSNPDGHGLVDSTRAFAYSCNPYFIKLGLNVGYRNLVNMADTFGLGKPTGVVEQGVYEASGNIPPENSYYSFGDIANISIGQGDILVTPLQAADIVATIANGGIKNRINIVDSIVDDEGNKIREIRRKEGRRIISKETSDKIRELMEAVTTDFGTGFIVRLDKYGGAGGKTGSAETGQIIDGEKVTHAWFAGYFPKVNPKYSMAVFVENGKYGGRAAAPIFARIAQEIMEKGL